MNATAEPIACRRQARNRVWHTGAMLSLSLLLGAPLFGQNAAAPGSGAWLAASAARQLEQAPLRDVLLRGTVTRTAGGWSESGECVLEARGARQARVELTLNGVTETTVVDASTPVPMGTRTGADGKPHPITLHNLWTPPVWFLPELSGLSEVGQPGVSLVLRGSGAPGDSSVQQLHFTGTPALPERAFARTAQRLSAVDYDLDPHSGRPVAAHWSTHPANDYSRSIAAEVRWSEYRDVSGVEIPFHLQKFYNGTLLLDIVITFAQINSNLPASDFRTN